jgi:hypothetical protein
MAHFQIQRNIETSYVYEFPIEDALVEQFTEDTTGKLPGGADYTLALRPGAPVKLRLTITTTKTEERGDARVQE